MPTEASFGSRTPDTLQMSLFRTLQAACQVASLWKGQVLPVEVLRAPGPVESRGRPPSCHRCRTTSTIWLEETRRSSKNHLAENDWGGPIVLSQVVLGWPAGLLQSDGGCSAAVMTWWWSAVTEFWGSHGMEEGKGERYLASGHQYGNALLGVRHQEEDLACEQLTVYLYCLCREVLPENWHSSHPDCPQLTPEHRSLHLGWYLEETEGQSTEQRSCHETCEY